MTTVAVVFERGAASAAELGVGLSNMGKAIFVINDSEYARSMEPVLRQFGEVAPLSSGMDRVCDLLRGNGVRAITTFSESMQHTTAVLAQRLGLIYHTTEAVELYTDKHKQRTRLRERGVDSTANAVLHSPQDWPDALAAVGLPAVLKPRLGEGSRHTYRIESDDQGQTLVCGLLNPQNPLVPDGLVLEELLVGRTDPALEDYVSVEVAGVGGNLTTLAVTGKTPLIPPFRETGQYWPDRLRPDERDAVTTLAIRALAALDFETGLAHVEIKLTDRQPRIIEVNGRLGGHQIDLASRCGGVNLIELGVRLAFGQKPRMPRFETADTLFQLHLCAPTVPARLVGIAGAREVLGIEGITGYRPYTRAGALLPGGTSTSILALISGQTRSHEAMYEAGRAALSTLVCTFEIDGSQQVWTGLELMAPLQFG